MQQRPNRKGATGFNISKMTSKTDLTSFKSKLGSLDVDKLTTVPADLSKLTNVVDNNFVKKLCMINLLSKSIFWILRYQVLLD